MKNKGFSFDTSKRPDGSGNNSVLVSHSGGHGVWIR